MTTYTQNCASCGQTWTGWGNICNDCQRMKLLKEANAAQANALREQQNDREHQQSERDWDRAHPQLPPARDAVEAQLRLNATIAEGKQIMTSLDIELAKHNKKGIFNTIDNILGIALIVWVGYQIVMFWSPLWQ